MISNLIGMDERYETRHLSVACPHCRGMVLMNLHIDKELGDVVCDYTGGRDGEN